MVASNEVPFRPFVSAETLKACALKGLHLSAAEVEVGSSGSQSAGGKVALKAVNGSALAGQARPPLTGVYEHNDECRAVEVIGQDWSSQVVGLLLEDWEVGRVALSCHIHGSGPSLPRN